MFSVLLYWEYWSLSRGARAERLRSKELLWAWEYVEELVRSEPFEAVSLMRALAVAAPGSEALAFLGAGPLEVLLRLDDRGVQEGLRRAIEECAALGEAANSSW